MKKSGLKTAHPYWFIPHAKPKTLGKLLPDITVRYAMTYGNPGVAGVLAELKSQGIGNLLVVPLYSQYAASSTGAALDKVLIILELRNSI